MSQYQEAIDSLLAKAAATDDIDAAVRLTQAAHNIANIAVMMDGMNKDNPDETVDPSKT